MIIYNTTFHAELSAVKECADYLAKVFIPEATKNGFLRSPSLTHVIKNDHQDTGESFCVQFKVKNIDTLNFWLSSEGKQQHKNLVDKFGSKITGFSTLLEPIPLDHD